MRKIYLHATCLLLTTMLLMYCGRLSGQVTTATLSGTIKNAKGEPLSGTTVKIEFTDAGISISLTTKSDGRFTVPNLRVGGPYRVTVTNVSYQQSVTENIYLELGQNNSLDLLLNEKTTDLTAITITGQSRIFDNKRTGASTNISAVSSGTFPLFPVLRMITSGSLLLPRLLITGFLLQDETGNTITFHLMALYLITPLVLMHLLRAVKPMHNPFRLMRLIRYR
ncbi:MAG: carboxypeptidase-like regulatory domain-containing protein [Chitinophagaceae bacterium]|nr:carboxypeptidase-like regulatory domain-containing protein [Chitinophagaceae bacterium]